MINEKKFYKDIVYRVAEQSECIGRKVGAIILIERRIIAEGWNSPPPGCSVKDCIRCNGHYESGKDLDKALCSHAEVNAISTAAYLGISLKGAVIICTTKPCSECAKLISRSGIKTIQYYEDYPSYYTDLICDRSKIKLERIT